eukprot:NODE_258_length_11607_cov_1.052659.p1 type:complete len:641 gc:universal NODE_258_length_11607_cov_1.052659:9468-11390(+)
MDYMHPSKRRKIANKFYGAANLNTTRAMLLQQRDAEYEKLERYLQYQMSHVEYSKERFPLICCSGPPGIGKTRFLLELPDQVLKTETGVAFIGITLLHCNLLCDITNVLWKKLLEAIVGETFQFQPDQVGADLLVGVLQKESNIKRVVILVDKYNTVRELLKEFLSAIAKIQRQLCSNNLPTHVILSGTDQYELSRQVTASGNLVLSIDLPYLNFNSVLNIFKDSGINYDFVLVIYMQTLGIPGLVQYCYNCFQDGNSACKMLNCLSSKDFMRLFLNAYNNSIDYTKLCHTAIKEELGHKVEIFTNKITTNPTLLKACLFDKPLTNEMRIFINTGVAYGTLEKPFLPRLYLESLSKSDCVLKLLVDSFSSEVNQFKSLIYGKLVLHCRYSIQSSVFRGASICWESIMCGTTKKKVQISNLNNICCDNIFDGKNFIRKPQILTLLDNYLLLVRNETELFDIILNISNTTIYFIQCQFIKRKFKSHFEESYEKFKTIKNQMLKFDLNWKFIAFSTDSLKIKDKSLSFDDKFLFINGSECESFIGFNLSNILLLCTSANGYHPAIVDSITRLKHKFSKETARKVVEKRNLIWDKERRIIDIGDLMGFNFTKDVENQLFLQSEESSSEPEEDYEDEVSSISESD